MPPGWRGALGWAVAALRLGTNALDNGEGLTPPLGWRSWNAYHTNINQSLMITAAHVLAQPRQLPPWQGGGQSSFAELGFRYVGIDEGWAKCGAGVNGSFHTIGGAPIVDTEKFPDLKQFTTVAHQLGLKAGWYAACDGCTERSWVGAEHIATHMHGTVKAIVDYGFDSVKLDSGSEFNNLTWWAQLLNATGRHILLENCHQGRTTPSGVFGPNQEKQLPGNNQSNGPCTGIGGRVSNCPYNVFRTSSDIRNDWKSMLNNLNSTRPFQGEPPLSRPGAWAYPDMLEVGRMASFEEDRTMFGAWVIVSSPLILGHDVLDHSQNERVWRVVANPTAIAINQAWHGHPGRFIRAANSTQTWAKPLSPSSHAVLVFSDFDAAGSTAVATVDLVKDLGLSAATAAGAQVHDVWRGKELGAVGASGRFTTDALAKHDSVLLKFSW